MPKTTSILSITLSSVALVGCTSAPDRTPPPAFATADTGASLRAWPSEGTRYVTAVGLPDIGRVQLPDWVVNPTLDGVLGSVGVAGHNQLGTGRQLDDARASARLEITRMLEVRVQDVARREVQQRQRAEGDKEVSDVGSERSMIGIDRSIADSVLAGSRQRAMWFDPSTGDCYVWMVMDGAVKTKADHYVENGVSVYVANTPITKEFRPKSPEPAPAPTPEKAPAPPMGPVEQLESRLKPIESVPIKSGTKSGASAEQGK